MHRGAGPRGYDGAKKLVGRKRVALVDAEGHVLALAVLPANVQDRDTLPALDAGNHDFWWDRGEERYTLADQMS
ncbi:transposase [Methylobacterium sp. CM6241]